MTAAAALAVPTRTLSPLARAVPRLPLELDPWGRAESLGVSAREDLRFERDARWSLRNSIRTDADRTAGAENPRPSGTVVPFPRFRAEPDSFAAPTYALPYSAPFLAQIIAQKIIPERLVGDTAIERCSAAYEATATQTDRFLGVSSTVEYRL